MKVFLKNIALFSTICVLVYCSALAFIININIKLVEKCDLLESTTGLIIGDSHTWIAINDRNLDSIQNISWNAEGYIYSYAKLRHVLNNEPNISEIFLGLSYHNFSSYYNDFIYGDMAKDLYHRYIGVLNIKEYQELYSSSSISKTFLSEIIIDGFKNLLKNDCIVYGSFPKERIENTYNSLQVDKRIQNQYYEKTDIKDTSEINIKYLRKIINLCREKNIKITMLQTPMSEEYKSKVPKEYIQFFNHFIQSQNLDLFDFPNLKLPDSCFLPDGDHVNYDGSVLTTNAFKEYYEERNNQ